MKYKVGILEIDILIQCTLRIQICHAALHVSHFVQSLRVFKTSFSLIFAERIVII